MGFRQFRGRMLGGERLVGTFLKVPAYETVEALSVTGLDFICLDAEHAPFDRARLDACLAVARALDFPTLVRVPARRPEYILGALDSGAVGVVVPHIDTVAKAEEIARAGRFGDGGRGFAGGTRWAGLPRGSMTELLERSREETVVIGQIEEPAGVEVVEQIAAVDGLDGLFVGPADLTVGYGEDTLWSDRLMAAYARVGAAAHAAGKAHVTFVRSAADLAGVAEHGVTVFFVGSEQGWMAEGARRIVTEFAASD